MLARLTVKSFLLFIIVLEALTGEIRSGFSEKLRDTAHLVSHLKTN